MKTFINGKYLRGMGTILHDQNDLKIITEILHGYIGSNQSNQTVNLISHGGPQSQKKKKIPNLGKGVFQVLQLVLSGSYASIDPLALFLIDFFHFIFKR